MPTKKGAKKQSGKKGGSKKVVEKRRNSTRKRRPINGDPPIIVGGGGSTLISIHDAFTLIEFDGDPPPYLPTGVSYTIFEVVEDTTAQAPLDIVRVIVNKGSGMGGGPQSPHDIANNRDHNTKFKRSRT